MNITLRCLVLAGSFLLLVASPASAHHYLKKRNKLCELNQCLAGQIIDYTNNHGADRRIWSTALNQHKDVYVYVPPGFDPNKSYPAMLWLHGLLDEAYDFLTDIVVPLDQAMACGNLPPMIVVAPSASPSENPNIFSAPTFYVNSKLGNYEDFIIQDVWGFLTAHYPVRPEREAHVIFGFSMGGYGAYNLGFKHPDIFKVIIGICPPLNMRWINCRGRYMADFDPCCWGWRERFRGHEVIGRFYGGLVKVKLKRMIDPVYGRGPETLSSVSRENPIEMIDRVGIREGQFDMFVAYGGLDEYNIDAQVESFLHLANCRGLTVSVNHNSEGKHNMRETGKEFLPGIFNWLAPRVAPFCPAEKPPKPPLPGESLPVPQEKARLSPSCVLYLNSLVGLFQSPSLFPVSPEFSRSPDK